MITIDDPAAKGELYDEIRRRRKLAEAYEEAEKLDLAKKERDEIAASVARSTELDDAGVQNVLRIEIKQRRDSAEAYIRANRTDLVDKELAEAAILEAYLPKQMSQEEIEVEVRTLIQELGASGPQDMNKVMPAAMSRLKGRADGRTVNQVVTRLLSQ